MVNLQSGCVVLLRGDCNLQMPASHGFSYDAADQRFQRFQAGGQAYLHIQETVVRALEACRCRDPGFLYGDLAVASHALDHRQPLRP